MVRYRCPAVALRYLCQDSVPSREVDNFPVPWNASAVQPTEHASYRSGKARAFAWVRKLLEDCVKVRDAKPIPDQKAQPAITAGTLRRDERHERAPTIRRVLHGVAREARKKRSVTSL